MAKGFSAIVVNAMGRPLRFVPTSKLSSFDSFSSNLFLIIYSEHNNLSKTSIFSAIYIFDFPKTLPFTPHAEYPPRIGDFSFFNFLFSRLNMSSFGLHSQFSIRPCPALPIRPRLPHKGSSLLCHATKRFVEATKASINTALTYFWCNRLVPRFRHRHPRPSLPNFDLFS